MHFDGALSEMNARRLVLGVTLAAGALYVARAYASAPESVTDLGSPQPGASLFGGLMGEITDLGAGAVSTLEDAIFGGATMADLELIVDEANVRAFLAMIRAAEGTSGPLGYNTIFGGAGFDGYSDHPRIAVEAVLGGRSIKSTAAGAYQILSRTWDDVQAALKLPDFSPHSQDIAAVFLIRRRRALEDVRAGRLSDAIRKCSGEWASLPGSPYGQPVITAERALELFENAGGVALA